MALLSNGAKQVQLVAVEILCLCYLLVKGQVVAGSCNLTVQGERYSTGYFGPTLLRSPPVRYRQLGTPVLCRYIFQGLRDTQRIVLKVRLLSVGTYDPRKQRCTGGHLRMWDGRSTKHGFPPSTICGWHSREDVDVAMFTTGHEAEVEFRARSPRPTTSFALSYTFVNIGPHSSEYSTLTHNHMKPFKVPGSLCSWVMNVNDCGDTCWVFSPGYPGVYPPNVTCQYGVTSDDPQTMLQLTFDNTGSELSSFSSSCQEEYISIRDGDNSSGSLIGRFCGRHLPSVTTFGRKLWLTFVSGRGISFYQQLSFRASVVAITKEWTPSGHRQPGSRCDWRFRGASGSISSPDHWLPAGTECRYVFDVTSGRYLEFIINIYGLRGQCDDEVRIYNGTLLVATLCSAHIVKRQTHIFYVESHRSALIYRTASGQLMSEPDRGFWLSFRLVDVIPSDAALRYFNAASLSRSKSILFCLVLVLSNMSLTALR